MGGSGSGRAGRFDVKTQDDGWRCLGQAIIYQSLVDDLRRKAGKRLIGAHRKSKYLYVYLHDWFKSQKLYINIVDVLGIDEKRMYNEIKNDEGFV